MSNTAYTRQTLDLERAGLNRILGYSKGAPASSPIGTKAPTPQLASTAIGARRLSQELKNLKAQESKTLQDASTSKSLEALYSVQYNKVLKEADRVNVDTRLLKTELAGAKVEEKLNLMPTEKVRRLIERWIPGGNTAKKLVMRRRGR